MEKKRKYLKNSKAEKTEKVSSKKKERGVKYKTKNEISEKLKNKNRGKGKEK